MTRAMSETSTRSYYNHCPTIEIVDQERAGPPVVSAPQPTQTTFIGKPMRLLARHKPGSGSGQYTLSNKLWTISGGTSARVKSYNIASGTLSQLASGDLNKDSVSYYYVVVNNGYTAKITAKLNQGGRSFNGAATATYDAKGPTNVTMTSKTKSVIMDTLTGDTSTTWLSFGDPVDTLKAGIRWTFTATAPAGDSGYVAGTQLANVQITTTPPGHFLTTAGSYWLDGCSIYATEDTVLGGGQYKWQSDDSPGVPLDTAITAASATDNFQMFFLYRPRGLNSIWVPIGKLNNWLWTGSATQTGNPAPFSHGWTGPTNPASSLNPSGGSSSTFPVWSHTYPTQQGCPALPTN
ncbi:MAG: hypothetical protein ACRDU4_04410 [Mycobacterium sp.]